MCFLKDERKEKREGGRKGRREEGSKGGRRKEGREARKEGRQGGKILRYNLGPAFTLLLVSVLLYLRSSCSDQEKTAPES